MKLILATAMLSMFLGNATSSVTEPTNSDRKDKKERKKEAKDKTSRNKNFHSVKKWKIHVEYTNGSIISKTIVVNKNSELSAMETAFKEAEKHLRNLRKVKNYSITPVAGNSYVLLAGD